MDKLVKDFLNRPLEGSITYIFVNASYFKVRTDGRYANKALLVVVAIHDDGYHEILSATVDDSEDESCWENRFERLKPTSRRRTALNATIFPAIDLKF